MPGTIHTAPPDSGTAVHGKTLPEVLYDACTRYENERAFNQPTGDGAWTPLSLDDFRRQAEETALGLLHGELTRGDKVAFFMESDVYFCLADMGCLIAGLINVPIYLTHTEDIVQLIVEHAEATAVFVSDRERLKELAPVLEETPDVETVILAESAGEDAALPTLPERVTLLSLDEVRERGRKRLADNDGAIASLREQIAPDDLATIIYTSGTTGEPKGVMLSHENISFNALTSFSGMTGYEEGGDGETAISFLPLTHVFARTLQYGYLAYGTSVYFTSPDELVEDMKKVRPTVFSTVPRVLEKVYAGIRKKAATMEGVQQKMLYWALDVARQYEVGTEPSGLEALKLKAADALVFRKWRAVLGGRIKFVVVGGAALNAELTNTFAAAGIPCIQGYGLTETSPVITFNRPDQNRAGTVGPPIPDVEVRIADDGEILTRGPHVMKGYFKNEERTREAFSGDGWFHTGDVGEFTDDGFLRITDRKKDLFKLSTGKYVMPGPLENRLTTEPLVKQAVVVGESRKFCAALIFPDQDALSVFAKSRGLDQNKSAEELIQEPKVVERYTRLVEEANRGMDHWSTIKRFALIPEHLTVENELLTPTMKIKRRKISEKYDEYIEALYEENGKQTTLHESVIVAPEVPEEPAEKAAA